MEQAIKRTSVFTKDIKDSFEALTIATSPTKDVLAPKFTKVKSKNDFADISNLLDAEKRKQDFQYRCDICQDICKRAVRPPCCSGQACRSCAVKFVTSKRSCWWCGNTGLDSDKLRNNEKLRKEVELFRDNTDLFLYIHFFAQIHN